MALTADRDYTTQGLTEILHAKLTASTTIFKGSIVALASGLVVKAADTAGYTPIGVAKYGKVAASGENPDVEIEYGKIWLPYTSPTQALVDTFVYATADDTLAATATNANPCGKIIDVDLVRNQVLVDFRERLPKTALA